MEKDKLESMINRNYFDKIIQGIDSAIAANFISLKLNAVAIRSFNTDNQSLSDFISYIKEKEIEIRFIEQMPFTGNIWSNTTFISSSEIKESLIKLESFEPINPENDAQTSRVWKIDNSEGKIGFISSVTESFCQYCDRIRITADGNLRPCLHSNKEYPLLHHF